MSEPTKKLFLLDAMALIFRAHFAFSKNPRINSKGVNTGVVLGFTNALLEIINKEKPTHIGVAFDLPGLPFDTSFLKSTKPNARRPRKISRQAYQWLRSW
jgi:DNA polymerase-1